MTARYQVVDVWGVKGVTLCTTSGIVTLWPENGTLHITADRMPTQLALTVTRTTYWARRAHALWTDPP